MGVLRNTPSQVTGFLWGKLEWPEEVSPAPKEEAAWIQLGVCVCVGGWGWVGGSVGFLHLPFSGSQQTQSVDESLWEREFQGSLCFIIQHTHKHTRAIFPLPTPTQPD